MPRLAEVDAVGDREAQFSLVPGYLEMAIEPHPDLPNSLFKYASPAAARAILANGSLQFSRPALFNDDFDLRINLAIEIDEEAVISGTLAKMYDVVQGIAPIQGGNALGRLLMIMRQVVPKPDREAFVEGLRPAVTEIVRNHRNLAEALGEQIGNEAANFKLVCLSASGINAPMWGSYASNVTGAVLQFAPNSPDSYFLTAEPVNYVDQAPVLFDDAGFISWLSGETELADFDFYKQFLYTKTSAWAYEQEWRIPIGPGWEPDTDREYLEFSPLDLEAVILGSRVDPDFQREIVDIIGARYPGCRLRALRRPRVGLQHEIVDL